MPKVVAPSRKVTVPVGMPVIGATGLTVALNVTDWPNTDGLVPDTTSVVVFVLTVCVSAAEVLVVKFVSPP